MPLTKEMQRKLDAAATLRLKEDQELPSLQSFTKLAEKVANEVTKSTAAKLAEKMTALSEKDPEAFLKKYGEGAAR